MPWLMANHTSLLSRVFVVIVAVSKSTRVRIPDSIASKHVEADRSHISGDQVSVDKHVVDANEGEVLHFQLPVLNDPSVDSSLACV